MVNHGFNVFLLGTGSSTHSIFGKCLINRSGRVDLVVSMQCEVTISLMGCLMLLDSNEKFVLIHPYFLMCDEYQETVNMCIYRLDCRGLIADGCPVAKVV